MNRRLSVLYIGKSLFGHPLLPRYLEREIERLGLRKEAEFYCRDLDPELPLELQRILESDSETVLIASDKESFTLVGRILSTLADDTLHLHGEMLIPAGASAVEEDSYLYRIGPRRINVLQIRPMEKLPPILLEPVGRKVLHLFPEEEKLPEALKTVLMTEHETLESTEILPGWYRLELYGEEQKTRLERALEPWRYRMIPGDSLVEALILYLTNRQKKITFAESCTGGLLAATFTEQPGASGILEGSYVTYANRIKAGWLGVREETLQNFGAVSRECVLEMTAGAQRNLQADIAIGISGIAGPSGAVPGKPVGTVWLCLRNGETTDARRLQLQGDRNAIQQQAVLHALKRVVESEKEIFDFFSENS